MIGTRPVRIGNVSGFYGDRASALLEMAIGGRVDVITGDYLAEVTMMILGKSLEKDPSAGYASTFLRHLEPALEEIAAQGIKVVVNAGGINPAGLAKATRELLAANGLELMVSHVEGDNIVDRLVDLQQQGHQIEHLHDHEPLSSWPHTPTTANAYLGGFGIAQALRHGADIVITGRVADASLVLGAAAWWWGWSPSDHDQLAGAITAGHVIECGTQVTGGNFSDFLSISDLLDPGFPIAEVAHDGSSVITKIRGTGGAVTSDTVTAQLLYEIGGPHYLNADVTTHLDSVHLADLGENRVQISQVHGTAPPPTTKVAVTALGGWESTNLLAVTGLHQDRKIELLEKALPSVGSAPGLDGLTVERIGVAASNPSTQSEGTSLLRVSARGERRAAGRAFSAKLVELALGSYPGIYFLGPPSAGSSYGEYWPGLIAQSVLEHTVVHFDGTTEAIQAPSDTSSTSPHTTAESALVQPATDYSSSTRSEQVPLGTIALARSGDKGGDANLGLWVRSDERYEWLRSTMTIDELTRLAPEAAGLAIERHEFPNLRAINFVIHGLLGSGAASSDRLDKQAKALGEWILSRHVHVPASLLPETH